MSDHFLNAYHFVPLSDGVAAIADQESLPIADAKSDDFGFGVAARDGHAVYAHAAYSGRIVCRLTTRTPLVVGGKLHPGSKSPRRYNILEPFLLDGQPAIPATSLKGMVSSVVEAASRSSMRVLTDRPLSYRKDMKNALHALGRLVRGPNGEWQLEPLTVPLLQGSGCQFHFARRAATWTKVYQRAGISYANVKCYVGYYAPSTPRGRDREAALSNETHEAFLQSTFGLKSASLIQQGGDDQFFYMRSYPGSDLNGLLDCVWNEEFFRRTKARFGDDTVLEFISDDRAPLTEAEFNALETGEKKEEYVRGFVRTLGTRGREVPASKKHELFIPYPEEFEDTIKALRIAVSPKALARFEQLAEVVAGDNKSDDPLRAWKPYVPFGVATGEVEWGANDEHAQAGRPPALREGQIVYFDVEEGADGAPVVSEISFSSIWRDGPNAPDRPDRGIASTHDFVRNSPSPNAGHEFLPMNEQRGRVTPAERIFGFVPMFGASASQADRKKLRAVAGRVRFSNARPGPAGASFVGGECDFLDDRFNDIPGGADGFVRLKELSSPKPPSPAMYFRDGQGQKRISKPDLQIGKAFVQGRKFYLHQADAATTTPWRTNVSTGADLEGGGAERKTAVKPVATNQQFWFHIDFDNLSKPELELLCFSLRPSPTYWQKLGYGKAVGLGSVEIAPIAILEVDRRKRYGAQSPFATNRFCLHGSVDGAPTEYGAAAKEQGDDGLTPALLATNFRKRAGHTKAVKALLTLGEHRPVEELPVLPVPLSAEKFALKDTGAAEDETFAWFVNNERPDDDLPRWLRPLDTIERLDQAALPANRPKPRPGQGRGGARNHRFRG